MSSTNPTSGTAHGDDHAPAGPPAPEVIARGYEADTYDAKSVLSVPLLVLLFFVLAFGTVTVIFRFIAYPANINTRLHPGAAQRNKAPLNERLNRIGLGHEVNQPRLEPLKLRSGDARAIPRPELPDSAGNSPELHPEDLLPTKERYPELYAEGGKKVGLAKPMSLDNEALKKLFPVQKPGTALVGSEHVPTASNSGRGAEGASVVIPPTPNIPPPAPTPAPPPKTKGGKQ
jgi:hypothetical protein